MRSASGEPLTNPVKRRPRLPPTWFPQWPECFTSSNLCTRIGGGRWRKAAVSRYCFFAPASSPYLPGAGAFRSGFYRFRDVTEINPSLARQEGHSLDRTAPLDHRISSSGAGSVVNLESPGAAPPQQALSNATFIKCPTEKKAN